MMLWSQKLLPGCWSDISHPLSCISWLFWYQIIYSDHLSRSGTLMCFIMRIGFLSTKWCTTQIGFMQCVYIYIYIYMLCISLMKSFVYFLHIVSSLPRLRRGLEVLLSPCVCVCLCVCPANILVFYFSTIRRDIDLKFIQDTYIGSGSLIVLNFHMPRQSL